MAWMWETRHCQSLRVYAPLPQAATVMLRCAQLSRGAAVPQGLVALQSREVQRCTSLSLRLSLNLEIAIALPTYDCISVIALSPPSLQPQLPPRSFHTHALAVRPAPLPRHPAPDGQSSP